MNYRKKFHIRGFKPKMLLEDSLLPLLKHHYRRVKKRAKKYQLNPQAEELHDLRIAIRRFRYNIELYVNCMKPKRFAQLYENLVELQNLLGERRDIDVMEEKIREIYQKNQVEIPGFLTNHWQMEKKDLDIKIAQKLKAFLKNLACIS